MRPPQSPFWRDPTCLLAGIGLWIGLGFVLNRGQASPAPETPHERASLPGPPQLDSGPIQLERADHTPLVYALTPSSDPEDVDAQVELVPLN